MKMWVSNYSKDDIVGGTEVLGEQFSDALDLRYMSARRLGIDLAGDMWFVSAKIDDALRESRAKIELIVHNSTNCWTEGVDGFRPIRAEKKVAVMCENFLDEAVAIRDVMPDLFTRKLYWDWPFQLYALKGKTVVTISEGERRSARRLLGCTADIRIIEPYVDLEAFDVLKHNEKFSSSDGRVHAIFVGREHARKGWDILLEVATKHPDVTFHCVIGKSGVAGNIIMYPYLDRTELCDLYNSCDFLFMPSRYESFGFIYAEAMACGLGILTTPVGLFRDCDEDLSRNDFIVTAADAQSLSSALETMKHVEIETAGIRKLAEKRFNKERFVGECNELFSDGQ